MRIFNRSQIEIAVFALAACALGCGGAPQAQTVQTPPAIPVTAAKAEQKTIPIRITRIGNVEASHSVGIKAQVAGELVRVHFQEGQDVRAGDLLFDIDPRPYQQALRQAEANLARNQALLQQAEANLARDQAQAKLAATQASRFQELLDQGIISKSQNEERAAGSLALNEAVRASQAAIESARANVAADRASIEKAKLDLSYCSIRSPIDGRTGNLLVKAGNLVKSNGDDPLVVINQLSPIYVSFTVPEQQLAQIRAASARTQLPVAAAIPDAPGSPIQGSLSFLNNAVDNNTGTIQLKATFANGERRLWPGQFIDVTLTLGSVENAVVVPSEAIQTGQSGQYAFVVKPDQTVESRAVKIGRTAGNETIVEEGVAPGETVVTDGQLRLRPGAQVRMVSSVSAGT